MDREKDKHTPGPVGHFVFTGLHDGFGNRRGRGSGPSANRESVGPSRVASHSFRPVWQNRPLSFLEQVHPSTARRTASVLADKGAAIGKDGRETQDRLRVRVPLRRILPHASWVSPFAGCCPTCHEPLVRHGTDREEGEGVEERDDVITSADVARLYGVAQRTVRYWHEKGLFQKIDIHPWTTPTGDLRFSRREVLRAIRESQRQQSGAESLRDMLLQQAQAVPSRRLAIANNKGGVGKTTVAVNLAAAIVELTGDTVLLIDADPQGNATKHLGFGREPGLRSYEAALTEIWDLPDVEQPRTLAEVIVPAGDGLWLAPMDDSGLLVEHAVVANSLQIAAGARPDPGLLQKRMADFYTTLARRLAEMRRKMQFDWVIIDTSPSLGPLTIQSLTACDAYLVPVEPGKFSTDGIKIFEELVEDAMGYTGTRIEPIGYLINHLKRAASVRRQFAEHIRDVKGGAVFETEVPESSALEEAAALGVTVLEYARRERKAGRAADAFRSLARELIVRFERLEQRRSEEVNAVG